MCECREPRTAQQEDGGAAADCGQGHVWQGCWPAAARYVQVGRDLLDKYYNIQLSDLKTLLLGIGQCGAVDLICECYILYIGIIKI